MIPLVTPQPDLPQETVIINESTSTQLFGVFYLTLAGLVNSMVPTNRPWALLRKLFSYIVKLAPILWWALSSGPVGCLPVNSPKPAAGWLPEIMIGFLGSTEEPTMAEDTPVLSLPVGCQVSQDGQ
ncbi:hypothetical protein DSO57_1037396 [Entomophthora muscae]|uniref:Uncharacterized protein n=1 Tax=Entomophthora muscae TaxID=34485 RepID=A0ACC2S139_9FUNG|nr:hypothetical protein DSO57_1037396 [Entomophthora muscae]